MNYEQDLHIPVHIPNVTGLVSKYKPFSITRNIIILALYHYISLTFLDFTTTLYNLTKLPNAFVKKEMITRKLI